MILFHNILTILLLLSHTMLQTWLIYEIFLYNCLRKFFQLLYAKYWNFTHFTNNVCTTSVERTFMCEYSHILIRKISKITNMTPTFFVASVTEKDSRFVWILVERNTKKISSKFFKKIAFITDSYLNISMFISKINGPRSPRAS